MNNTVRSTFAGLAASFLLATGANASSPFGDCAATDIAEFPGTVVDAAIATPELSTLVDAVVAAGLADALATAEDITVYAPTNDAFGAVPADILNTIVGNTDLLTAVLTYHVSPGMDDPRKYYTPVRRNTLQGQKIFLSRANGAPRVNNASISCQGVSTSNGMVWIIDSVILPAL